MSRRAALLAGLIEQGGEALAALSQALSDTQMARGDAARWPAGVREELSGDEFARVARRVHTLEEERWDREMDQDASAGRLDFLIAEAQEDRTRPVKRWPDGK